MFKIDTDRHFSLLFLDSKFERNNMMPHVLQHE